MLDESERAKIRLEEEYRHEVRNKLQETPTKRVGRLWTFLNSSFGLWLLSAICITGLGTLYAQRQSDKAEQLKKLELAQVEQLKTQQAIERLDSEIGYRLSQIQVRLNTLNHSSPKLKKDGVMEVLNSVSQPPGKSYFAAYPEYSNYSLIALVAELRRYVNKEDRDALRHILADLTGIYVLMEVEEVDLANIMQVAKVINKKFISGSRWFDSGYYFLDCPEEAPLC
jgi:hypothetical protein